MSKPRNTAVTLTYLDGWNCHTITLTVGDREFSHWGTSIHTTLRKIARSIASSVYEQPAVAELKRIETDGSCDDKYIAGCLLRHLATAHDLDRLQAAD